MPGTRRTNTALYDPEAHYEKLTISLKLSKEATELWYWFHKL
jgi:hypothetical protein